MSKTYEMLWDCKYCGTPKLLGKTHRHCPSCGSAQDPAWRYYPADADKVAVEDHVYMGADKVCRFCSAPNARTAKHCGQCGGALDDAGDAVLRKDQTSAAGFAGETLEAAKAEHAAVPAPKRKSKRGWMVPAALALVGLVLVALFWKRAESVEITGHRWEREVRVERFGPVADSSWCNEMPRDAYQVSRSREVRTHEQVPDGEDCHTRRSDQGDGTFKETEECTTRYRSEPVYDDRCRYTVDRWEYARSLKANGASLAETPAWPEVKLERTGTCAGCEREGARAETYVVRLRDAEGEDNECLFPEERWRSLVVGARLQANVGVLTDRLDCDSLR